VSAEGFRKGSGGVRGVFLPNLIEIIPSEGSLPTGSEVDRLDPFCGSPTRLLSAFLIFRGGKNQMAPNRGLVFNGMIDPLLTTNDSQTKLLRCMKYFCEFFNQ
jgi:hypothetical protein